MLASLRIFSVLIGIGVGGLGVTILALAFWAILAAIGVDDAPLAGLTAATIVGFVLTGFAAGRSAPHTHRFHGAVAGLGVATVMLVVARLGGSPAPLAQVLLLLGLGIVLGGIGGILGGRRRAAP